MTPTVFFIFLHLLPVRSVVVSSRRYQKPFESTVANRGTVDNRDSKRDFGASCNETYLIFGYSTFPLLKKILKSLTDSEY